MIVDHMELGSEFSLSLSDLTVKQHTVYEYLASYDHPMLLESGRDCIRLLSRQLSPGEKVLLPEFICESVISCFSAQQIVFYHLNDDFEIDFADVEGKIAGASVFFLMHYFGSLQPGTVLQKLRQIADNNQCIIIEDATHSLFSSPHTIGDYVICSIRKWVPVPAGGILLTVSDKLSVRIIKLTESNNNDRCIGMVLKDQFIRNGLNCNSNYRHIFSSCEKKLDAPGKDILGMSDFARFILSCIDIPEMVSRRRENYTHLRSRFALTGPAAVNRIRESECPFVYVIRVPNRDRLRSYLMNHKIYCAVHWPLDGIALQERPASVKNATELLSLPIDQRYDLRYMDYLADTIMHYGGDLSF